MKEGCGEGRKEGGMVEGEGGGTADLANNSK